MIIESDFYRTEAGRKHFTMQLDSIRYCVQEARQSPSSVHAACARRRVY